MSSPPPQAPPRGGILSRTTGKNPPNPPQGGLILNKKIIHNFFSALHLSSGSTLDNLIIMIRYTHPIVNIDLIISDSGISISD